MHHNVFNHHDGVVDHQADGRGQSAQRHQVEALANDPESKNGDGDGDRDDEAGDQRASPVAQEEEEDDAGQDEPDEDGVAHAGDAVAHQLRLVVEELELDARRQLAAKTSHLRGHRIGYGNRVAGRLAGDCQQHRIFAVCRNGCVDGQGSRLDRCYVGHAHGSARGRCLHDELAQPVGVVHLRSHQAEDQLMIGFVQAGRIHDVRSLDGVYQVRNGHAGVLHQRQVWNDVKLRHLATLHDYGADALHAIQGRLQIVSGNLPKLRWRNGVGSETVAEDGKGREREPVRSDLGRGRQRLLHLGERRIHQLERLVHVHVPIEEQADFGLAAAGNGANGDQPRHGVYRILDGLGDRDLHLLHRHHAVVDADDYARKVRLRKDRDGHLEGEVDASYGENGREEEDGARGSGQPEGLWPASGVFLAGHQLFPPPAGAGAICTFVPSSRP